MFWTVVILTCLAGNLKFSSQLTLKPVICYSAVSIHKSGLVVTYFFWLQNPSIYNGSTINIRLWRNLVFELLILIELMCRGVSSGCARCLMHTHPYFKISVLHELQIGRDVRQVTSGLDPNCWKLQKWYHPTPLLVCVNSPNVVQFRSWLILSALCIHTWMLCWVLSFVIIAHLLMLLIQIEFVDSIVITVYPFASCYIFHSCQKFSE